MNVPEIDSPEMSAAFSDALKLRAAGPPLRVELQADVAALLIGVLQLALRHPHLPEHTRQTIEPLTRFLIGGLCDGAAGGGQTPAAAHAAGVIRRVLESGFDPRHDVTVRGPGDPGDAGAGRAEAVGDGFGAAFVRVLPDAWRHGFAGALTGGAFRGTIDAEGEILDGPDRGRKTDKRTVYVYFVAEPMAAAVDMALSRESDDPPEAGGPPLTPAENEAWFSDWYHAMPAPWQAGLWEAIAGKAWRGELVAGASDDQRHVDVFFVPHPTGEQLARALESGTLR